MGEKAGADAVSLITRVANAVLGAHRRPAEEIGVAVPRSFEEQIYAAVVAEGDTCYDVGANYGEVAVFLARLAGRAGLVVAFEPVMPVYCQLCTWTQLVSGPRAPVVTLPFGLAESEKLATIQVPAGKFAMGSLALPEDWSRTIGTTEVVSYPCRFSTLALFIRDAGIAKPDFIKIDVEGAELLVLRGAAGMFRDGHRPLLLIELFAPWERAFGYGPWDVLSLLAAHDYGFLFACPQGLVEHRPTQDEPFPPEYERGYNVLAFCPVVHAERVAATAGLRRGGATVRLPMSPPSGPNVIA